MLHTASQTALTWYWFWHPLAGPGYQFWSGIASDLGEITLIATIIGGAIGTRQFLHSHFECHEETCGKLGFHHVPGTPFRTCWHHHPVLKDHPEHGVPLGIIHEAHKQANEQRSNTNVVVHP